MIPYLYAKSHPNGSSWLTTALSPCPVEAYLNWTSSLKRDFFIENPLFRRARKLYFWMVSFLGKLTPLPIHIYSSGATIDFVLSGLRDAAVAKRLFRKALTDPSHPQPRVINTGQARLYGSAISGVRKEGILRPGTVSNTSVA